MTITSATVTQLEYHRNGMAGEPFWAFRLDDPELGQMLGVYFEDRDHRDEDGYLRPWNELPFHNPRLAIFSEERLPTITFGVNSWRGDHYAAIVHEAIREDE